MTYLSGTWDGFVALQAVTRMKIARGKCVYSGEIRQGQRYYILKNEFAL